MTAWFSISIRKRRRSSSVTHLAQRLVLATGLVLGMYAAAACGGGDEAADSSVADSSQVAGVSDLAGADDVAGGGDLEAGDAATSDPAAPSSEMSPEDAALAFSQCMRDHGLDVGDLVVKDGQPHFAAAFEGQDLRSTEFREAAEECRPIITAVFGDPRATLADNVEIQDAFVEFSACVRADGWDVGDLKFEPRPGEGGPPPGANDQEGERGSWFRRRHVRLAHRLGLDPEDPAVMATIESCAPIISHAFHDAGFGFGGPPPGGGQGGGQ